MYVNFAAMKKLSDSDLRKATIFDLTDDKDIINEVLGFTPVDSQEFINSLDENGRIVGLYYLAEVTGDNDLMNQVNRIYEKELAHLHNE